MCVVLHKLTYVLSKGCLYTAIQSTTLSGSRMSGISRYSDRAQEDYDIILVLKSNYPECSLVESIAQNSANDPRTCTCNAERGTV